ncbi:MAG TPA: ADP-glyceromanno-heptose 6-epimerase [Fusobacterium sp.]|uniref:ADP-glyceromanno-heptose 6-epimerase n=1 Tax=Fusobacterium sp. TaxID=68766 RepID=UPI002F3FB362
MIVVTGAAGMIGSAVVWKLNEMGIHNILLVDKLRSEDKWLNIRKRDYRDWMDRDIFLDWLSQDAEANEITAIVHMGACSATTETNADYLMENNYGYTKALWNYCSQRNIRFIYASSAATYGGGEKGYNDEVSPEELKSLQPLNKYGYSKKRFDDWAFKQKMHPSVWAGLKFFNVYGPQEYHKGRMASMVYHSFKQYQETGKVKLFQSHKEGYEDGGQLRDFVYLKDVVDIIYYMLTQNFSSGIYNIGTGEARSFLDLAMTTIKAASGKEDIQVSDVIEFIPMPEDLRGKYQYFTQATMEKLSKTSYHLHMHSLEEGIKDYVQNYLSQEDIYL